jgi:putative ABC transport system permease protein
VHNATVIVVLAWRAWRSAKGVAVLAVAALAVGIGSATSIYSVVNAVMLKPLPYRDGDRFVALFSGSVTDPERAGTLQLRHVQALQERTRAFDALGWFREAGKNLMFAGEPHHVQGIAVSIPLAHALGVEPAIGRWFQDEGGVVISTPLWRRLGSETAIVGRPLTLDGVPFTVSGVMPQRFRLPVAGIAAAASSADVWMPLRTSGEAGGGYVVYARRRPGISLAAAQDDVRRVAAEIAAEDPGSHQGFAIRVFDLRETVVRPVRPTLLLLLGAAGLLFLITCANAAGLLLARAVARARETATRAALGARRSQLAAQYFAEGLLMSLAGAAGGLLVSVVLTPAIVSMAAAYFPRLEEVSVDWSVLLFALAAGVVACTLSSLAPLWQAIRTAPAEALGEGVRASAGTRSRRLSRLLVIAEIALAFGLLAASSVLILHVRNLSRVAPGFEPANVLTFVASVPGALVREEDTRIPFQRRLVEALKAVPGVEEVAFANQLPLVACCQATAVFAEGRPVDRSVSRRTSLMAVSPRYFHAMRIPLLGGRLLTDRDPADDRLLVVVNQAAARRYWGDGSPVGAYGRLGDPSGARFEVLGVVGDVKNERLGSPTVPEVYLPGSILRIETMHFVIRSSRPAASLVPDIRRAVRSADPELPIHRVATMNQIIADTMTLERLASFMTGLFAAAALLLAMVGVYGVVAYSVRQRTVEIGTRMALGATSRGVLSLIVADGLKMAGYGMVVGAVAIAAAVALARALEIGVIGPAPFLYSTAVVAAMAFTASSLPAWRASALSPMAAIREQPERVWEAARLRARQMSRERAEAGQPVVPLGAVIAEFAGLVRGAASFAEAVRVAVSRLGERAGAQSIVLLEKGSGEYRGEACGIPADGVLVNRLRHYPHPMALTEADFEAWLRWAREARPEHVPEIESLRAGGARMAVALRTKHEIAGVLLLGAPAGRDRFTAAEKQMLDGSADVLGLMIENARLNERALEQEKLRRDLALAAEVQKRLLPPEPPDCSAATLAAFTLAARTVGGDYYDFLELPGGRIGIAVADVAGKGIPAALLMAAVQASLRAISAETDISLSELACKMNAFLFQSTGANKYATFFHARVEARASRLRYVNAGHNPPYLARRTASGVEITELGAGGPPIGLFPDMRYEEAAVDLRPGDLVVAFTDGVPEALDPAGEEFGEERLKNLLRDAMGETAPAVSRRIVDRMREWVGEAPQHDDITCLVLAVNQASA